MALKAHLKRTLEHWPALYAGLLRLRAYLHPTAGEPELRLLPRLCPGDEIAIDVGANHGDYTAILVGLARDVIAVEPNPDIVRVLEARLGDEIRRQRLQLVQGALGAEAGTARLFVPDAGSGLASLDAPPIATAGKAIEVSVRRLDDLVGGRRVGFIKIDVEGYEVPYLQTGSSSSRLRRSTSAPGRSSMRSETCDSSASTAVTGAISWSTIWALPAMRSARRASSRWMTSCTRSGLT